MLVLQIVLPRRLITHQALPAPHQSHLALMFGQICWPAYFTTKSLSYAHSVISLLLVVPVALGALHSHRFHLN
jgi:hypothetical protein